MLFRSAVHVESAAEVFNVRNLFATLDCWFKSKNRLFFSCCAKPVQESDMSGEVCVYVLCLSSVDERRN